MNFYRKYLLPGFVFQSILIGGGYATGRELVEFFFASGPIGGILGLLVSGLVFGIVMATGFEFARVTQTFEYRSFCRELLGKAWFLFEMAYFVLLLLVLAIIASASGKIVETSLGLDPMVGTLGLMLLIGVLTYTGSEVIKNVLAAWSILLYVVYFALFFLAVSAFGDVISTEYSNATIGEGWVKSGFLYSGYNLAVLPAVIFVVAQHSKRKETIGAGLLAGLIAIIPALLFFIAMMGQYPQIGEQAVPASYLMSVLNIGWFELIFQLVLFGTFVETGTALLHSVNERLEGAFSEKGKDLPQGFRPFVSTLFLIFAIVGAAKFGIVELIADGYNLLTLVFIIVLIIPLMTRGIWMIINHDDA